MAGELWREIWQVGKEGTFGTPALATRKVYLMEPTLTREREPRPKRFSVGDRSNQRAQTLGPVTVAGTVKLDVSPGEMLEWLECMLGTVTPAAPTGPPAPTLTKRYVYKPQIVLPSMTIERYDAARLMQATGVQVNTMSLAGSVAGANEVTFGLFGGDYKPWAGPLSTVLDHPPAFMDGWQTNMYLDAIGGVAGTTPVANAGINWSVDFSNNLGRKRWAGNTLAIGAITTGEMDITAQVMLEASAALTATEVANWEAQAGRLLRLEFLGPPDGIETGYRESLIVDLPGAWSTVDFNTNDEGTRTYTFNMNYLYSAPLAAGIVITAQCGRTGSFAA